MGDVGVSFDDFCRLTFEEIDAILMCRGRLRADEAHREWEIMRLQTYITLSPFCKNLGSPKNLLPFPWDNEEEEPQEEPAPISQEERRANERKLRERLGW